uniref:Uncharacterized protein n=1 Tax=Arundo donax TaxID=35708 RepID=A0A0A9C3T4_ARUDO
MQPYQICQKQSKPLRAVSSAHPNRLSKENELLDEVN